MIKEKPVSKPGKHGTLYLYAIKYRDKYDSVAPEFEQRTWAYSEEHALDRFYDTDDDGWLVLAFARVIEGPSHRMTWHAA